MLVNVISFHLLKVLILIHHAHGSQTLPNHSTARVVIIDKISNIMGSIGEIIIGYMFYDGLLLIKIIKYFVEHRNTVFIYLMLVLKVKDNREINRRKKMCLINSNMLRFLLNHS